MKQEDLARSLGTTQSSISGWINGKYEPSAATVFTIERELGLDPGTLSRPLGYLPVDPAAHRVSVESAIAQCATLDDEAKVALASIYRALVAHSVAVAETQTPRYQPISATRERLMRPPPADSERHPLASGH